MEFSNPQTGKGNNMPTIQYVQGPNMVTKNMLSPKKISVITSWYNQAKRTVPEIPVAQFGAFGGSDWMISHQEASLRYVKFELLSIHDERAVLVILR